MLGQPDGIYPATPGGPASGPGSTRLTISPGLTTDVWVRGFDFKPGDKRSVRAAFFSIAGTGAYLGGWTPWSSSTQFPDGTAIRLPAKASITVDVLYGTAPSATEPAQLGLYFAKAPSEAVTTFDLSGEQMSGEGRMRSQLSLTADQALVGVRVEMSAGAKSLELKAMRPDGSVEPLLWIKEFRPEWQSPYVFRAPVPLPRGSVIVATAFFDPASASPRFRVAVNGARPHKS